MCPQNSSCDKVTYRVESPANVVDWIELSWPGQLVNIAENPRVAASIDSAHSCASPPLTLGSLPGPNRLS